MAKGDRFDEDQLKQLMQTIRDGDAGRRGSAVLELIDLIDGWILSLFHSCRVDFQDYQDLQQTVVVKIMQGARLYRDGSVVSWIKQITTNVVMDHFRKLEASAAAPMPEGEDAPWPAIAGPLVWGAWEGKAIGFPGPDIDQWSEGQRRLALEACIEHHLQQFEADDPKRGAAVRKASLEQWSMRQLGQYLGKNENNTRVYTRESRLKSARYFEECMQFVKGLADRRRKAGQGEGST